MVLKPRDEAEERGRAAYGVALLVFSVIVGTGFQIIPDGIGFTAGAFLAFTLCVLGDVGGLLVRYGWRQ